MNMIRLILLLTSSVFLSGCGLGIFWMGTYEYEKDNFYGLKLGENRCDYSYGNALFDLKNYQKEELIELWGTPDREGSDGSLEYVTYFDGFSWTGLIAVVVVVPVPLAVPSGLEEHTFYFEDNTLTSIVREYTEFKFGLGFGCGSNECDVFLGVIEAEEPYY